MSNALIAERGTETNSNACVIAKTSCEAAAAAPFYQSNEVRGKKEGRKK